jgi:hypothetical protein
MKLEHWVERKFLYDLQDFKTKEKTLKIIDYFVIW